jgi:Tol biopolymer transport system component
VQLPHEPRLAGVQWSPDGSRLAFANVVDGDIELWVLDVATGDPRREDR